MNRTHPPRPGPGPDLRHYTPGHHDRDWTVDAACRDGYDPELWFPDYQRDRITRYPANQATRLAQHVCQECPVQAQCLHHALTTDTRYGIWGGATAADRARLTGRRVER